MRYLRTNTAIRITVGPFLDKTDGITPETALTATNEHLTLMVDDGNVPTLVLDANATASGGNNDMVHVTGDDAGFYDLELTAANLNYLGRAMLSINYVTDHCPVFHEFMILPAVIYDAMILGTDLFDVSMTQILGTAISTPATAGILDINLKNIANAAVSTSSAQLGVNVVNLGGSAVDAASGLINANVKQISTDATAADNAEAFFDGTGYAGTGNTIPTVTTLTNAPSDSSGVTTLLTRLSATRAGYLDNLSAGAAALEASVQSVLSKLLKYVQLILRKDSAIATDNATEVTAINADGGTGPGSFANTTDSQEALRDRGDAAWTTATGFSTLDAAGVRSAVGLASANLDTQLDTLPTAAENASAVLSAAASNPIDANVQEVNDVALTGDGSTTPWGPA